MATILIFIGGHLCTAPRPQKEAEVLVNAGYEVIVSGFWFDLELVERDRLLIAKQKYKFRSTIDFQPKNKLTNYWIRIQAKIAKEFFRRFKLFLPELLGYGAGAMLKYAQSVRADLTIVHSEAGLWVGQQLLDRGLKVGVDFEDWFSEDLLPEARSDRPIHLLKNLERLLVNRCKYCLTTSLALAEALSKAYQAPKPIVVYNVFPWQERSQIDGQIRDRQNLDLHSIHWFSQTIGQGRGLEILFRSLPYINQPVEIHLRGNYPKSSRQWLEPQIPAEWRDYIFIHPTVSNSELLSRISEHDIGLALEIPYCFNKQFTISNKLFQYLQAGLAVIATDTEGQSEVLSQYPDVGQLVPVNDPKALANAINCLINDPHKLNCTKKAALKVAQTQLNWENQENTILEAVARAISQ